MNQPRISIILIIYRMSRQAENTLYSLSTSYQQNVSEDDYEVIVIENTSDDNLGEERAAAFGKNVRYTLRDDKTKSPVGAINYGFECSRAPLIGLMIDGARLASPRILEHALNAQKICDHPLVVVPGYHLGATPQHNHASSGHDEHVEQKLLQESDWKNDGYNLFNISCISPCNQRGAFGPFLESNCIFSTRESFEKIGWADERFDLPGGGSVNIHMYHALGKLPENKLIVLAGEGTFHQFHGGITTTELADRDEVIESHQKQLRRINGGTFKGTHREPMVLGSFPPQAKTKLIWGAKQAQRRFQICRRRSRSLWDSFSEDSAEQSLPTANKATISIVLTSGDDPEKLTQTLQSLSVGYQRNVSSQDYEVLVFENSSCHDIDNQFIKKYGNNFRLIPREEWEASNLSIAEFALSITESPRIGIMPEILPVLTPRVIEHALLAEKVSSQKLVVVPGYRLNTSSKIPGKHSSGKWLYLKITKILLKQLNGLLRRDSRLGEVDGEPDGYELLNYLHHPFQKAPNLQATAFSLFVERSRLQQAIQKQNETNRSADNFNQVYFNTLQSGLHNTKPIILVGEGSLYSEKWKRFQTNTLAGLNEILRFKFVNPSSSSVPLRSEATLLGVLPGQMQKHIKYGHLFDQFCVESNTQSLTSKKAA